MNKFSEKNRLMELENKLTCDQSCVSLASEIEHNLLPQQSPRAEGADIAGWCVYSRMLGGNFFDYHNFKGVCCSSPAHMRILVGDASGHGVCSALLMTSTRAYFRARAMQPGDLSQVVTDVNRLLCMDVEFSGHFVTAFYASIYGSERKIEQVRAGHPPALIYNPVTDAFAPLHGKGMALGIDSHADYPINSRRNLPKGTIAIIASDVLWEVQYDETRLFGRKIVKDLVRRHRHESAAVIAEAVKTAIRKFLALSVQNDDMTFTAAKFV